MKRRKFIQSSSVLGTANIIGLDVADIDLSRKHREGSTILLDARIELKGETNRPKGSGPKKGQHLLGNRKLVLDGAPAKKILNEKGTVCLNGRYQSIGSDHISLLADDDFVPETAQYQGIGAVKSYIKEGVKYPNLGVQNNDGQLEVKCGNEKVALKPGDERKFDVLPVSDHDEPSNLTLSISLIHRGNINIYGGGSEGDNKKLAPMNPITSYGKDRVSSLLNYAKSIKKDEKVGLIIVEGGSSE